MTRSLVPVVAMLTRNNIPAPTPTPDLQVFNLGCDRVMLRYTGALVTLIVNLAKNRLMAINFMQDGEQAQFGFTEASGLTQDPRRISRFQNWKA
jgi:hypothetical protein